LQRNIEYLAQYGIGDLIINVHHFAAQIIKELKKNNGFGSNVTISDESEVILETGGGLKKAAGYFSGMQEPFVLMNVDVLTDMNLTEMIDQHNRQRPLATLAVTTRYTSRYFLFDEMSHLCGWKNIKTGEQKVSRSAAKFYLKAFSGIHVIAPAMLPMIRQEGKFSMVDVYLEIAKTQVIAEFDHSNTKFIDVGKPASLLKASALFP
jgi:MurNAc alpha-1-phosphate uridylyltransferase